MKKHMKKIVFTIEQTGKEAVRPFTISCGDKRIIEAFWEEENRDAVASARVTTRNQDSVGEHIVDIDDVYSRIVSKLDPIEKLVFSTAYYFWKEQAHKT
jgi:hypothetical protein